MAKQSHFNLLWLLLICQIGCQCIHPIAHQRNKESSRTVQQVQKTLRSFDPADEAMATSLDRFSGTHTVEVYVSLALEQNPEIQAARKRMEAVAHQVTVAASLQDPMLSATVFPEQVQTAAGQQEFSLTANQKLPWHGKLDTRAQIVEAEANAARAHLATEELNAIAKVKRAYYELYYIQQTINITESDRKLLYEIRDVADSRYKTAKTSQQDLLRAELEIANVEKDLIQLRQQLTSAQAKLAKILHLSPQSDLRASELLPPEDIPRDLNWLQHQAVTYRPELHAQLALIERDRRAVELADLDYFPDVTVGMSWIDVASAGISPVANGRDAFLLSAGINIPIYKKRLNASVQSAEAKAVASARTYDSLKDSTLEEVTDLFAQAQSQQALLTLFREDILPKSRQTLEVSSRAYSTGEIDFLQLLDNWRQLLRYEISNQRLEASLRQTLAELERVVGGFQSLKSPPPVIMEPIIEPIK